MIIASLITLWLITACTPEPIANPGLSSPTPTLPVSAMTELPAALTATLVSFLSQETGIPPTEITLQQAEALTWNDSCLGISQPDEMCAQVITPGYRATFNTSRGRFTIHSDRSGRSHRLAQSP